jgi:hypothetical protein
MTRRVRRFRIQRCGAESQGRNQHHHPEISSYPIGEDSSSPEQSSSLPRTSMHGQTQSRLLPGASHNGGIGETYVVVRGTISRQSRLVQDPFSE